MIKFLTNNKQKTPLLLRIWVMPHKQVCVFDFFASTKFNCPEVTCRHHQLCERVCVCPVLHFYVPFDTQGRTLSTSSLARTCWCNMQPPCERIDWMRVFVPIRSYRISPHTPISMAQLGKCCARSSRTLPNTEHLFTTHERLYKHPHVLCLGTTHHSTWLCGQTTTTSQPIYDIWHFIVVLMIVCA